MIIICCFLAVVICAYVKLLWKCSDIAPVAMILPLFEVTWYVVSLIWIEHGTYITEAARYSYYTGATIRFIILTIPFFGVFPFVMRQFSNERYEICEKSEITIFEKGMLLLGILLNTYCMIDLIYSGCPRFDFTIGRFTYYYITSKLPFAVHTRGGILFFLIVVAGMICIKSNRRKYIMVCWFICIFTFLNSFLLRCKFYGYYNILFLFLMPFLYKIFFDSKQKKMKELINKKLIIIIFFFFLLIGILLFLHFRTTKNPYEAFMGRLLAHQGHVFWGSEKAMSMWPNSSQLKKELHGIFEHANLYDRSTGLVYAMQLVAPQAIVERYLSSNIRFYGFYVITSSLTIGYVATFFYSAILAIYYAFISKALFRFISKEYYIGIYIILELFDDFYDYFRMGNYNILINTKDIVFLLLTVLFYFGKPIKIRINKNKALLKKVSN